MFAEIGKGCIGLDQVMVETEFKRVIYRLRGVVAMGRVGELAANIQAIENDPETRSGMAPKHRRAGDLVQAQHRGDHGAFSVVGKRRF